MARTGPLLPELRTNAVVLGLIFVEEGCAMRSMRCAQLVTYYDRFGVGRSTNSDGRRNHTRIGAEIDCSRGLYAQGIAAMLDLLQRKAFTPPPPLSLPSAPGQPPDDD